MKKTNMMVRYILPFGVFVSGFTMIFFIDPAESHFFPPCPFHYLTGYYCPGCGSLRAMHCLSHGDLLSALSFNPLMIFFIPYFIYETISYVFKSTGRKKLPVLFSSGKSVWIIFIIIMIYWLVRNMPYYPFKFLAP